MQTIKVQYSGNEVEVNCDEQTIATLQEIKNAGRGQFAFIRGHISGLSNKKCLTTEISDRWFLARPKYGNYVRRMTDAICTIDATKAFEYIGSHYSDEERQTIEKYAQKNFEGDESMQLLFDREKETLLSRLRGTDKTTSGHRMGQDVNYADWNGWRIHLVTGYIDGVKRPVVSENGLMKVDSIMLPFFEIKKSHSRNGLRKGVYKLVKSRGDTLMRNAVKRATGISDWKTFSLNNANFESISLSGSKISGWVDDAKMDEINKRQDELCQYVGQLSAGIYDVLESEKNARIVEV